MNHNRWWWGNGEGKRKKMREIERNYLIKPKSRAYSPPWFKLSLQLWRSGRTADFRDTQWVFHLASLQVRVGPTGLCEGRSGACPVQSCLLRIYNSAGHTNVAQWASVKWILFTCNCNSPSRSRETQYQRVGGLSCALHSAFHWLGGAS